MVGAWGSSVRAVVAVLAGSLIVGTLPLARTGAVARAAEHDLQAPCQIGALPSANGGLHTLALDASGDVWASGWNAAGQLGDGTTVDRASLTRVGLPGSLGVTGLAAGGDRSFAVTRDGQLWGWGRNGVGGAVGDGSQQDVLTPVRITGVPPIRQVATGAFHTVAVTRDGTVWTWGANGRGQLGTGSTQASTVPVQVPGLVDVVAVAAGENHTLALRGDGTVLSWGQNLFGQLGDGTVGGDRTAPAAVTGLPEVTAVAAHGHHSLAVAANGTVRGWGNNGDGQVGDGSFDLSVPSPRQVTGLTGVSAVVAGRTHSVATRTDGSVWAWGNNQSGQLGAGSAGGISRTPVQAAIADVRALSAGGESTSALVGDGGLTRWGGNDFGQLGDGTTTRRATPFAYAEVRQRLPAAPEGLAAVAGERLAYLTWEPAATEVVTQYVITPYLVDEAQPAVAAPAGTTEQVVEPLSQGTGYRFDIAAQNCLGTGPAGPSSNPVVPTDVDLRTGGAGTEGLRINDRTEVQVNTFNGNVHLVAQDVAIAGRGADLIIARSYHARSSRDSAFGNGWSASLATDVRLELRDDGSALLITAEGAEVGFARSVDGAYVTPAGMHADLVREPDEGFTLTERGSDQVWSFDPAGALTAIVDRNGNRIDYAYDGAGRVAAITESRDRTLSLRYDDQDRVVEIEDHTGRVWAYGYDASGALTSYTDPSGATTRYRYDGRSLTRVTTAEGRVVAFTYDDAGRLASMGWPLADGAPETSFDYEGSSTIVTDPRGNATTYAFDPVGRPRSVTDARGNTASDTYSSASNVTSRQNRRGGTTQVGYAGPTNLTSLAAPTGAAWELAYDDADNPHQPTTARDPQGNLLRFRYDQRGNLASQSSELPDEETVRLEHRSDGALSRFTDPKGAVTRYDHDDDGQLTSVVPPVPLGELTMAYDDLSRLTSMVDGNGDTTRHVYDDLDRLVRTTYQDGTSIERGYDRDGNLTSLTDPEGVTSMLYGPRNLLVERSTPDGSTVSYTYDQAGNLTSLTDVTGRVEYDYDEVNLPVAVTDPDGSTVEMAYDADYNRTSISYPNGVAVAMTYDDTGRLTRVASTRGEATLTSFSYDYRKPTSGDPDTVLRYQRVDDVTGDRVDYVYDQLNRLVQARERDGDGQLVLRTEYRYDGAGNRLERRRFDGTLTLSDVSTYNAANQLVEQTGETFTYDGHGQLTGSSAASAYTYNALRQTVSVVPRVDRGLPASFTYRGDGQSERTAITLVDGSAVEEVCVPLVTCLDLPDVETAVVGFTHSQVGVTAISTAGVATGYTRAPDGTLLAARGPMGTAFFTPDGLGSTVQLTDEDGLPVAEYAYGPFGETLEAEGSLAAANPWRYAGYHLDPTGLYKSGERYYDPVPGRWTQQDPLIALTDPRNWNRYVYAGNDPINHTDPTGLFSWSQAGCAASHLLRAAVPFVPANNGGYIGVAGSSVLGSGASISIHTMNLTVLTGGTLGAARLAGFALGGPFVAIGVLALGYGLYRSYRACGSS